MSSPKIYSEKINVDEDWLRAKDFGINASTPDAPLISQNDFTNLAYEKFDLADIKLKFTYRDFGKLASSLGYRKLFFQESPYRHCYDGQPFQYLIQFFITSYIQYVWVKKYIDESASSKIRADLKKVRKSADTLSQHLKDFTEYHQQIKIRQIVGKKGLKDQLKEPLNHLYRSRAQTVIEEKIDNYNDTPNSTLSWSNLTKLDNQLSQLSNLIEETEEIFSSKGGAPYKFSRTWLILEAVHIYEEWNVNQLAAGTSMENEKPTGPTIRFLQHLFDVFDDYKLDNSGLGSETAKILTNIFSPRERIMHKKLGPDLPIDELLPILKILKSHR